jgi:phosphoserine phosphatase RsbU/P
MFAGPDVEPTTVELPPRATLVLYTDGVTDARSPSGRFHPDLAGEVLPALGGCSPDAVAAALEEAVVTYQAGNALADIAIMALSTHSRHGW